MYIIHPFTLSGATLKSNKLYLNKNHSLSHFVSVCIYMRKVRGAQLGAVILRLAPGRVCNEELPVFTCSLNCFNVLSEVPNAPL